MSIEWDNSFENNYINDSFNFVDSEKAGATVNCFSRGVAFKPREA